MAVDGCGTEPSKELEPEAAVGIEVGMGPVMLPGNESDPLGLGPGTMTVLVPAGPVGNTEIPAGRVLTFDEPDTPDGEEAESAAGDLLAQPRQH